MPGNQDGLISIVQWRDMEHEAAGLANYVQSLIAHHGYDAGDILIMTPRRPLGYGIRDCLSGANVPAHSFFNEEPLEHAAAQRAFAILSLIADPEDRVALRWWLGNGSTSGRAAQYQKLRGYCEQHEASPKEVLDSLVAETLRLPGTSQLVDKYRELQDVLQHTVALGINDVVDYIIPDGQDELSMLRKAALEALPDAENIGDVHGKVRSLIAQPEIPEQTDFVRVMSLHKAKGLTSKVAIVAGCIQGLIPTVDRDESQERQAAALEEQRRLFYVAITRCTDILVLSSAIRIQSDVAHRNRVLFRGSGRGLVNVLASQFIGEFGPSVPQPVFGDDWAEAGYDL